jgi:hypothetical protein
MLCSGTGFTFIYILFYMFMDFMLDYFILYIPVRFNKRTWQYDILLVNVGVTASCSKRCCLWPEDGPLRSETYSYCKLYVNITFISAVLRPKTSPPRKPVLTHAVFVKK